GGGMGGGGMGGGGMGGGGMGGGGEMGLSGGEMGLSGGGVGQSHSHPGTAFEGNSSGDVLVEEFGSVAGAGGMGGFGEGMSPMAGEMSSATSMGSGKSSAAKKEVRYVDDAEKDQGYKTRAFLLDVVIRDERLPDLLAKLTNSDFPVEIVRVEIKSRSAGGMSGMSGMSGGYSGGAGMSSGYGAGMSGSGMGMPGGESSGGLSSFSGGSGGMGLGMAGGGGAGPGGFPGLGSMSGEGGFSGADGEVGMMGAGVAKGAEVLNAAMVDPTLIDVHIGGLLTLYMTPEESETQAKTEEISAKEAEKSTPTGAEPVPSDVPLTSGAVSPGAEAPATIPEQDISQPAAPVPDASPVGSPAAGSVPGQAVTPEPTDPPASSESSPAVPDAKNVPDATNPLGAPAP
ncbi:MAG: hypothetical protein WKF77_03425, partial [Planctomycetaceae bacterium]